MLRVDDVTRDARIHVRGAIDEAVVEEYAERLADDVWFPPVVVFRDGSRYSLADGFHRLEAFRRAGREQIEALVHVGTPDDALWFGLAADRNHWSRLTRADRWHAIGLVLDTWPDLTRAQIARHLGCSWSYVSKVRAQLSGGQHVPPAVQAADGPSASRNRSSSPVSPVPDPGVVPVVGGAVPGASLRSLPRRPSRRVRDRSNRIVSVVVLDAQNLLAQEDLIDFAALDRGQLSDWIAGLDRAAVDLGRLVRRLREEATNGEVDALGEVDDPSRSD